MLPNIDNLRSPRRLIAVMIILGCFAVTRLAAITTQVAFVDVNIVPMDRERVLEHQTVLVEGDRIVAIGPVNDVKIPAGSRRIAGAGRFLMPGLADMHMHFRRPPAFKAWTLLLVANGVTTVRDMFGSRDVLALRDEIAAWRMTGPTIYPSGPLTEGPGGVAIAFRFVDTPVEAEAAVADDKRSGYDAIKVYDGLSRQAYDALVAAARRNRMRVYGHVPTVVGLTRALEARQDSIEHLSGYIQALQRDDSPFKSSPSTRAYVVRLTDNVDMAKLPAIAKATAEGGVWNCPTLLVLRGQRADSTTAARWLQRPEMKYVPPTERKRWEDALATNEKFTAQELAAFAKDAQTRSAIVRALRDAGAPLLAGTDSPPGFLIPGYSLHEELRLLVEAGLTPYEALRASTSGAAQFLKAEQEFGSVAVGRRADLLLLDANPLTNIENAARRVGVMLRGEWWTAAQLMEKLEELARSYGR